MKTQLPVLSTAFLVDTGKQSHDTASQKLVHSNLFERSVKNPRRAQTAQPFPSSRNARSQLEPRGTQWKAGTWEGSVPLQQTMVRSKAAGLTGVYGMDQVRAVTRGNQRHRHRKHERDSSKDWLSQGSIASEASSQSHLKVRAATAGRKDDLDLSHTRLAMRRIRMSQSALPQKRGSITSQGFLGTSSSAKLKRVNKQSSFETNSISSSFRSTGRLGSNTAPSKHSKSTPDLRAQTWGVQRKVHFQVPPTRAQTASPPKKLSREQLGAGHALLGSMAAKHTPSTQCNLKPLFQMHRDNEIPSIGGWPSDPKEVTFPKQLFFQDWLQTKPISGELDLSHWPVSNSDLEVLSKTGAVFTRLRLDCCSRVTDAGVGFLTVLATSSSTELRHLSLRKLKKITDFGIIAMHDLYPRLFSLDLSDVPEVTPDALRILLSSAAQLRQISFQRSNGVTDATLTALARCCRDRRLLVRIDLSGCCRYSNEGLLTLLHRIGFMAQSLNISDCIQISDIGLFGLCKASKLRHLDMSGCIFGDVVLGWLAEFCSENLKALSLSRCKITSEGLKYFKSGFPILEKFVTSHCDDLTDEGFEFAFQGLPQLTHLDVSHCTQLTDRTLVAMSKNCPLVQHLFVPGIRGISNPGLRAVGRACLGLQTLDCTYSAVGLQLTSKSRITQISNGGLQDLAAGCAALKVLKLSGACKISDSGMVTVASKCQLLEVLTLKFCHNITSVAVGAIGRNCGKLVYLELMGCVLVDNEGVVQVAEGCPELCHLDVVGLNKLTDISAKAIGNNCHKLEFLDLQGCDLITDSGLQAISIGCQQIKSLGLKGLDEVTDKTIEALAVHCLNLRKADFTETHVSDEALRALALRLPYAINSERRMLHSVSKPVALCNEQTIGFLHHTRVMIKIQSQCRRKLAQKEYDVLYSESVRLAVIVQCLVRRFLAKRKRRIMMAQFRIMVVTVKQLQKWYKKFKAIKNAREAEVARQQAEEERQVMSIKIQKCWRGKAGRKIVLEKRKKIARVVARFEYVVDRKVAIEHARLYWISTRIIQKMYRAYRLRQDFKRKRRQVVIVQSIIRQWIARRICQKRLEEKYMGAMQAASRIQRRWRLHSDWVKLISALRESERQFRMEKLAQRTAAEKIQHWWKGICNVKTAKAFLDYLQLRNEKVEVLQRAWRVHYAKYIVKRLSARRHKNINRWRLWQAKILAKYYRQNATLLQKRVRRWLQYRRELKKWASTQIQRVWRGWLARRLVEMKKDLLQRERARARRRAEEALRIKQKESVLMMERVYCKYKTRKMIKMAARRIKDIAREQQILEKKVLIEHRAVMVLERFRRKREDRAARLIQKWYHRKVAERQEEECEFVRQEMEFRDKVEEEERARRLEKRKAKQEKSAGRVLAKGVIMAGQGIGKLLAQAPTDPNKFSKPRAGEKMKRRFRAFKKGEPDIPENVKQTALHAVVKHHIGQVDQKGIVDIVLKVGQAEDKQFRERQFFNSLNKLPEYKKIDKDLSGKESRDVYLWYLEGEGKREVMTSLVLQLCLDKSNVKMRTITTKEANGQLITHPLLDLEIIGYKELGWVDATPIIEKIAVSRTADEAAALKEKGFEMVKPGLHKFKLGETCAIWVFNRVKTEKPDMVDNAAMLFEDEPWFTPEVAEVMSKYALSAENIHDLHELFIGIVVDDQTTDFVTLVDTIKEQRGRFHLWLLQMVDCQNKFRITFLEFLKIVCFFCMFSPTEVKRFVFGMMDSERRGYIEQMQFIDLCDILLENENMPMNRRKIEGAWEKYCIDTSGPLFEGANVGPSRMYFDQFVKVLGINPVIIYPALRNQTNMQKRFMGEAFWSKHKTMFSEAREQLGVKLKGAIV